MAIQNPIYVPILNALATPEDSRVETTTTTISRHTETRINTAVAQLLVILARLRSWEGVLAQGVAVCKK